MGPATNSRRLPACPSCVPCSYSFTFSRPPYTTTTTTASGSSSISSSLQHSFRPFFMPSTVSHHRLCSLVLLLPLALVMLSRPTAAFRQLALRSRPSSAATTAGATAAARRPFSISCLPVLRVQRRASSPLSPSFFVPSFSSSTRLMAGAAAPDPRIKVRASHILVKTEEEADALLAVLENGADFGELAMVESDCPSRKQGGDLGWFGAGQMVPAFEEACFNNAPGAFVKVQTEFGYHIIQVTGKATAPGDWHPSQLGDLLKGGEEAKKDVQLIDVREPDELLRADIKGAGFLNLPLSQFPTWRAQVLSGELLDKSKKTIVICHHGGRSMQVASFLTSQAGFESVFNLSGGINMYSQLVDDSIPMY